VYLRCGTALRHHRYTHTPVRFASTRIFTKGAACGFFLLRTDGLPGTSGAALGQASASERTSPGATATLSGRPSWGPASIRPRSDQDEGVAPLPRDAPLRLDHRREDALLVGL